MFMANTIGIVLSILGHGGLCLGLLPSFGLPKHALQHWEKDGIKLYHGAWNSVSEPPWSGRKAEDTTTDPSVCRAAGVATLKVSFLGTLSGADWTCKLLPREKVLRYPGGQCH